MRHQRLESVVVEGFTSIRSAALTLQDLNVLVGANGAGKSNFIRALSLLGRIVDGELGLFAGLSGRREFSAQHRPDRAPPHPAGSHKDD
jgi:ABC-type uncharacterized transport system ATPase subunit